MSTHQSFHSFNFVEGFLNNLLREIFIFFVNGNIDKGAHQKLGPSVDRGFRVAATGEDSQTE